MAFGHWLVLLLAWALAYFSRKLGPTERLTVSVGLPLTVGAGGLMWLWARYTGRAGAPLPADAVTHEIGALVPLLARVAAVLSVLYLGWRVQRRHAARES